MTEENPVAVRVYVDAKILGAHEKTLPKTTYVGYFVEGSGLRGARRVDADQTDDAEIQAILFAIDELKPKLERFTIVCDHESVVSEAKRKIVKKPSPLLEELRRVRHANPSIEIEALKSNPAHRVLTEYVNRVEQNGTGLS